MLLTALDFLRTNPRPTEQEIREGISAVLCRCTGYHGIVKAIAAAAPELAGASARPSDAGGSAPVPHG
jgi:aerobic-type carbon monoxide dehydrogenase small subunit (CoxS/CutS family)